MDRDYTAANPNYHMVMSVFGTSRCPLGGEQIHFGAGECRAEPRIAGHPAQSRFLTCRLRPIDWPRSAIGRDIAKSVFQVHGSYHPRAASDRMRPLQTTQREVL